MKVTFSIIGIKQKMKPAKKRRAKKLKELEDRYKKIMSPDIVKEEWLKELKELDDVIIKGTTSPRGWMYNEPKMKFK